MTCEVDGRIDDAAPLRDAQHAAPGRRVDGDAVGERARERGMPVDDGVLAEEDHLAVRVELHGYRACSSHACSVEPITFGAVRSSDGVRQPVRNVAARTPLMTCSRKLMTPS